MMIGISTEDGRQKLSKLVSTPLKDHLFAVEDLGQFSKLIIHLKDLINDGKLQCVKATTNRPIIYDYLEKKW
jgi:hypothetical protein